MIVPITNGPYFPSALPWPQFVKQPTASRYCTGKKDDVPAIGSCKTGELIQKSSRASPASCRSCGVVQSVFETGTLFPKFVRTMMDEG